MLQISTTLVPAIVGSPGTSRYRRGGRSRSGRSTQEELGKWIWIESPDPINNSYIYARKIFQLSAKPTKAIIKASADSKYKLFVNGQYVGKGPVRSGEGCVYYDSHDVTDLLNKGKNVIAVIAHHFGEDTYSYTHGRPGLICKAEIEIDGETQIIGTDDTWKVRRAEDWTDAGARLSHRLGFQEVYNAERALQNWTEVKFNERGWETATVVGTAPELPWGDLKTRRIPQLREARIMPLAIVGEYNSPEMSKDIEPAGVPDLMADSELSELKAGKIKNAQSLLTEEGVTHIHTPRGDKGVVLILDFGREVFGNVELGIAGSSRGCIDMGYGELLQDGRVKPNRGRTKYTDRVNLHKGKLEWQGFEPRAFRYLQIEFRRCSKPVALDYIRVNQTTYPVEYTGNFECSDRLLNEIWETGAYTARLCMEDTYIDCPWRERAQWWGDARIESRVTYYAFGDTDLLAQGLKQIASSQGRDGSISGLYPSTEDMLLPDFSLLWVFSILDHFAFVDDPTLLRNLYPNVRDLLRWFAKYTDEDGLLADVPGQLFLDWAELEKRGEVTALNCLYYQALRIASVLASISEHAEEAEEYLEAANRLKIAINKFLYVPKRGLYAECRENGVLVDKFSRQTNIFAALFDIADQYQKSVILRQMMNGALPELTTPYFASYLLEALYSGDQHDYALNYIRRKWGEMIKAGATTFWETFGGEGSLCHGWSTCPTRDLLAEYVGIKPVLGSHRFAITPHTGDLKWARGSMQTQNGLLTVEWRISRGILSINVQVPEGLRVDVYPPGPHDSVLHVDGKLWPSRLVTFGAGSHRMRVTPPKPQKPTTYDENPIPGMPHVELLEDTVAFGRRRSTRGEPRKHTRPRRGEKAAPIAEVPTATEIAEEERIVEQAIEVTAEPTAPGTTEQTPATEEEKRSKRRPRRRGGRRHSKGRRTEQPAETGEHVQTEQPSEHAESAPQPEPTTKVAPEVQPVVAEEPAHEEPAAKPAPKRPRRRRTTKKSAAAETPAEQVNEPEQPTPPVPVEAVPTAVVEPAVEKTEGAPTEASAEEKPKRKRRTYTRRNGHRRKSNGDSPESEAAADQPPAEPENATTASPE